MFGNSFYFYLLKFIRVILFVLLITVFPFKSFSQGLIPLSKEEYDKIPSVKIENQLGFVDSTPDSYSLEKYVPKVQRQRGNSCVGFAYLYYGLSTQYNAKLKITNPIDKIAHSFDPYYAYNLLSSEFDECIEPIIPTKALELLKKKGAKKKFYSPHIECFTTENSSDNYIDKYTKPYSIDAYHKVSSTDEAKVIISIQNKPVIFGMFTTKSFFNVGDNGYYALTDQESMHIKKTYEKWDEGTLSKYEQDIFIQEYLPHAMTIIGYDDNKFGGAFRVVNSYGKDWGDKGYFWLKYKDFKTLTTGVFTLDLSSDINYNKNPQFNFDGYQRVTEGMDLKEGESYEGFLYGGKRNGIGIDSWTNEESKRFSAIGNFENNIPNGFFTFILSEEEYIIGNYIDGEYVNMQAVPMPFYNNEDEKGEKNETLEKAEKQRQEFIAYMEKKYGKTLKLPSKDTILTKSRTRQE